MINVIQNMKGRPYMKKKKNRNIKMTIAAGLLITPAIVAQAGEVQASEQPTNLMAAATAEELLNSFKAVNEESSVTDINTAKKKLSSMSEAETNILGTDNLKLVEAKLDYLTAYIDLKKDATDLKAAINKLKTTNKTLVTDTEAARTAYTALQTKIDDTSNALSAKATADTTDFLSTLLYYNDTTGEVFLEEYVTKEVLDKIGENELLVEKIKPFLADSINPIQLAANGEATVKVDYEAAVTEARTDFNAITDTAFKNLLKIQIVEGAIGVEQFIKNAELDLSKAKSVEDKITDIEKNPPTATTFSSKITAINTEYNKLTELQKALVSNYVDFEKYSGALEVVTEITNLSKLAANSQDLRDKLPGTEKKYNELETLLKNLVTNESKLTEMLDAVGKAEEVEGKITAITIATPSISEAREAFNALTSTEKRYVKKEASDLLTSWEKSSTTATNVVKQINAISSDVLKSLADEKIADTRKVSTVSGFVSKVRTAESTYSKIKPVVVETEDEVTEQPAETREQQLVTNRQRLEQLIPFATIADQIVKLKITSTTYREDLSKAAIALEGWNNNLTDALDQDTANLVLLQAFLVDYITGQQTEEQFATALQATIESFTTTTTIKLEDIVKARADYNTLSANGKRLVTNIKTLTDIEKQYKSAVDTAKLIDALDPSAKDFARKTIAAQTAHNKLTPTLQELVYNKEKLDALAPIAQLMIDIDALRPTAADFKTKLSTLQAEYDKLLPSDPSKPAEDAGYEALAKYRLFADYKSKLVTHNSTISNATAMDAKIDALKSKTGEQFMTDLKTVSDEYKKLDANTKRSVSNAKVLTELERDYKASLRVIDQIEKLPAHTDRSFASKVATAKKAYDRLTDTQQKNVYNYASKLQTVEKAAELIERLEKLRIGSKTYEADVKSIREEFGKLSASEQALVHNISKLTGAEASVVNAAQVMELIELATPTAEAYIEKLTAARVAYDSLAKNDQKLVLNYKDLTTRERTVKPVLKLDADILALDPSNAKTFISKFKAADKAYEKLTIAERGLLLNADRLTGEMTSLYNVINTISTIKNSSKTFVEDTKRARGLYETLPGDLKAKVSNYNLLLDHERNVEGGKAVDAMIQALNSAAPKEFITKVKEARAAFKSLSATNKKAVTLEYELKEQEKYIKPVEVAIKAIDDLSDPRKDLSRQFTTVNKALQKLDATQMTFVSNIDKYSNLSNVIHAYTLIAALKPNDKYYQGNIEAAKTAYEKLSEEEKVKVTNYYKLQEAILDMTEVQKVTSLIASLNASSSNFFADIEKTQAAYKALPSGSRKQVLNYATLQQAEKDMKAAQKVIKQIDDLDPELRTYASKAKAAKTAYERLTTTQKPLVNNYNKLQAAIFELGL